MAAGAAEFVVVVVDFGRGRELEIWIVRMDLWGMWEKGRVNPEMRDLDDKEEEQSLQLGKLVAVEVVAAAISDCLEKTRSRTEMGMQQNKKREREREDVAGWWLALNMNEAVVIGFYK